MHARAAFESSQALVLTGGDPSTYEGDRLSFEHCILASGSVPAKIPAFDLPTDRVMDSTGALELRDIPESLLVVGGGYIGLELGTVYSELGQRRDRRRADQLACCPVRIATWSARCTRG